jgi:flavin reductase (DIM6/NTAB) family NADH-FMN oxidoreductase RutF
MADSVRRAARRFATGVTIVAVRYDRGVHAVTANSFVTLSLRPPLIGMAVGPDGRLRRLIEQADQFGVSVLNDGQDDYARHYARRERDGESRQLALPTAADPTGVPIVPGCVAYFACERRDIYPVGDHDLIVGSVLDCDVLNPERPPLIFLDGRFQHGG